MLCHLARQETARDEVCCVIWHVKRLREMRYVVSLIPVVYFSFRLIMVDSGSSVLSYF